MPARKASAQRCKMEPNLGGGVCAATGARTYLPTVKLCAHLCGVDAGVKAGDPVYFQKPLFFCHQMSALNKVLSQSVFSRGM